MIGANALLNPSRFEGWSTTVEEAKAVGTPMLLSDIAVHREQAPQARFFAPDDALSLANEIEGAPMRSLGSIATAMATALKENHNRQIAFAQSICEMVFQTAELTGASKRTR